MKKVETEMDEELKPEYDLRTLRVRKLGSKRKSFGDTVRLEPDVAEVFTDAESVNKALRALMRAPNSKRTDIHKGER